MIRSLVLVRRSHVGPVVLAVMAVLVGACSSSERATTTVPSSTVDDTTTTAAPTTTQVFVPLRDGSSWPLGLRRTSRGRVRPTVSAREGLA